MAKLTDLQRQFLENPYPGVATTLRADGSPHATVVWVDAQDGVSFNTTLDRAKAQNLQRDPRVSLVVVDPNDMYKWLSVTGRAELTEEGAVDQIDRLSLKYRGTTPYGVPEGQRRVRVRIAPEKITAYGID